MSSLFNLNNCCVIIRSTGERTESLCKYSVLKNGVLNDQIFFIKNISPFSEALKKGYELALHKNKEFTFFIDADIVVLPNSLNKMIAEIKKNKGIFFVNPSSFDYFFNQIKINGPHLYRTKFLKKALDFIPNEKISRRPETYVVKKMNLIGYKNIIFNEPVALHEFEQYNKDIFNRSFNKFVKFPKERWELFKRIKKEKKNNYDFEIAYKVFKYLTLRKYYLKLDYKQNDVFFKKLNIKEKKSISEEEIPELYKDLCNYIDKNRDKYFKYKNKKKFNNNIFNYIKNVLVRFLIFLS